MKSAAKKRLTKVGRNKYKAYFGSKKRILKKKLCVTTN